MIDDLVILHQQFLELLILYTLYMVHQYNVYAWQCVYNWHNSS